MSERALYRGSALNAIDAKARVAIPAGLRQAIEANGDGRNLIIANALVYLLQMLFQNASPSLPSLFGAVTVTALFFGLVMALLIKPIKNMLARPE